MQLSIYLLLQLAQIDGACRDPHPLQLKKNRTDVDMGEGEDEKETVLAVADPAVQETLVTENEPDGMDAEQTWPTEEELAEAEREHKDKHKRVVKVSHPVQLKNVTTIQIFL